MCVCCIVKVSLHYFVPKDISFLFLIHERSPLHATGRDERMAKGHEVAVNNMLEYSLKNKKNFTFIDASSYLLRLFLPV